MYKTIVLIFLTGLLSCYKGQACRFTVREIGFSTLSQDIYSLVVLDDKADPEDEYWSILRKKCREANVRLVLLHPESDHSHPMTSKLKELKPGMPVHAIVAPNGRSLIFDDTKDIETIVNEVLDSPIRKRLRQTCSSSFSVVLWTVEEDNKLNKQVKTKVQQACEQIENLMPHMPKIVEQGPVVLRLEPGDWQRERVLLWSLGLDKWPQNPKAIVLYGRGRIMGDWIDSNGILEEGVFKHMSLIGADCECGLDRKWMLGSQVPLLWPESTQQELTDELGFDVDNPMILAEMSRIMAKETEGNGGTGIGFGPEKIDLNELLGDEEELKEQEQTEEPVWLSLIYVLSALIVFVSIVSLIIYIKRK
ncbi:hypothetical protein [Saccharicrinis sp. GN24d3]|uniref:hypothetical protein n=1 Tax=Saccharicrinis sp. GN24d3 TaxID=3458416 RepID=UPI004036239E